MAGVLLDTGYLFERPSEAPQVRTRLDPVGARSLVDGTNYLDGPFTENLPVTPLSETDRTAACLPSFFDDYYNRVYFIPSVASLGAVSVQTDFIVQVWNAHLNETTLTAVSENNAQGLTLSGAVISDVFDELEIKEFTITSTPDGPASIAAQYTFDFDTPETFTLRVSGNRARLIPVTPSWQNSLQLEYSFRTDITESRSGKEQRRALRDLPRKTLQFFAVATNSQLRDLNGLMAAWQNNVIVAPEIPRQAELMTPISGGATATLVDTAPDWALDGAQAVLAYRGRYESVIIQQAVGTALTLAGVPQQTWPVGTRIHPALAGRLQPSITARRESNVATALTLQLDVTPGSEPVVPVSAAPALFDGLELVTYKPNWGTIPQVTYQAERELVDYGFGVTETSTPIEFRTRLWRATYVGQNYDAAKALLDVFLRAKGQRGEFYMPTWEKDINISAASTAGTQTLRVAGTQFAKDYAELTTHKAVSVYLKDGTVIHAKVQSIIEDAGDSVLQVDTAWPVDFSNDDVNFISWLLRWRFATDNLTIEWLTDTVAQCQFALRTVEDV